MQGGPGSVGEARDMEALAEQDEVSMECNEVQEEDSDSYGKHTNVFLIKVVNEVSNMSFLA